MGIEYPRRDSPEALLSRLARAFDSWPIWLQIVGGLSICFGVGAMAGLGWAAITIGIELLAVGVMAEK